MAELNQDQLETLEKMFESFDRLTRQARTTGDVIEQNLSRRFQKSMDEAAKAARKRAEADAKVSLAAMQGLTRKQREQQIDAAGRRAARAEQQKYNDQVSQASQTMQQLGQVVGKLTSQLYRGEQGAKMFGDGLEGAATAIGALTFLMGGPLVKVITVLTTGLFKLGAVAAEQSDALFKSFQSLQRVGGNASDGLQGIFDVMQNLSLGIADLEQMNALIGENALALSMFRGTVYDGARALGAIGKEIKVSGLRGEFMRMGLSIEDINNNIGGYITLQSRLGQIQSQDTQQITASLKAYIRETDAITKLTGATRKQQEEAQLRAMNIEQFRAHIMELRAKGDAESLKRANELTNAFKMLSALGPGGQQAAEGLASMITGIITPGSGVSAALATNSKALGIATDRTLSAAQITEQFLGAMGEATGPGSAFFELAKVGAFKDVVGLDFGPMQDAIVAAQGLAKRLEGVTDEQERMRIITETGVKAQVDMRESQMNSRDNLQSFVQLGVNPATVALAKLAGVVEGLTALLPGKKAAATGAGAVAGAATGAAVGSVVPGVGTAIGAGVGGIIGGIMGFFGASSSSGSRQGQAQSLLEFDDNGSGTQQNFGRLDRRIQDAVLTAAAEYNQLTNRRLKINSAYRDPADQRRLYEESVRAGRPGIGPTGMPIASPGSSLHERGLAVDIQQYNDPVAVAALNRAGLFQRVATDPVHFSLNSGGIASGPKSGYQATLHGTEAVVPLPDGRNIPVDMPTLSNGMQKQIDMMTTQISRLDDLILIMRNQNSISTKILQVSQS